MSDWTPGPWRVSQWGFGQTRWPDRRLSIVAGPENRPEAIVISPRYRDPESPEMLADARLIAAAPRMVELLTAWFKWDQESAPTDPPDGSVGSCYEPEEMNTLEDLSYRTRSLLSELNPPPRTPGPGGVGMEIDLEGA